MVELIPAIIAVFDRRKLQQAGAFSESASKKPEELSIPEKWLQILRVRKTNDGRYYVEEK